MRKLLYFASFLLLTGMSQSCLFENDIDYPYIKGEITAFEVEGQKSVAIDGKKRTVSVVLEETADMSNLKVKAVTLSADTRFADDFPEYLDLTDPVNVTLQTYQDYPWIISATQPIERYVHCENQVGEAVINEAARTVHVAVTQHQSRKAIVFTDMKLGPEGSRIVSTTGSEEDEKENRHEVERPLDGNFPVTLDCFYSRTFTVEYKGRTEIWTMTVESKTVALKISMVSPWVYSADIIAGFDGTGNPVMEYRKAGDGQWTVFGDIKIAGTEITAKLTGLEEGTGYDLRFAVGDSYSEICSFETGRPEQIVNMGFDDWWQENGKIWYPNADASVKIWDTANGGSALLSIFPTIPEETNVVSGKAARLETKKVAMVGIAAGNIYTGKFKEAVLDFKKPGAKLTWGTPFTGRPKSLKGYYAYAPKLVDVENKKPVTNPSEMDKCQILVILADWDVPFEVSTADGKFLDQENDPGIIAYAKFESDEPTFNADNESPKYKEFELELDYRRPDATPKYAVVIACASYKGDYFTGGVGSTMYVDEFEFVYE